MLARWLESGGLSPDDCLELSLESMRDYLRDAGRLWSRASAGLTGGWDTRAVAAVLLSENISNFYFRTRGNAENNDVIIARKLADLAGAPHRLQQDRSLPPPTLRGLRRNIDCALRWQSGHVDLRQVKTFLPAGAFMDGGNVNIMGQHGEIGRGFYLSRLNAFQTDPARYEDGMIDYSMKFIRPFLHPRLREAVIETVRQAFRQAERYDLDDFNRLDFFYLYERTRRWASGGQYAQPGKVITPFLNPRAIRANFNLPAPLRLGNPFHAHIIRQCAPQWIDVPYQQNLKDLDRKTAKRMRKEYQEKYRGSKFKKRIEDFKRWLELLRHPAIRKYRETGRRTYGIKKYWEAVGTPLIREILAGDGLWTEVYDRDQAAAHWGEAPDDLAVLHGVQKICDE